MKLTELGATFLKIQEDGSNKLTGTIRDDADGVMFQCPKCFAAKGSKAGCHQVICWFVGVSALYSPGPGRWNPTGSSLDDLTFVPPGAVSVLLKGGCGWHGFVKNGDAS